MKISPSELDELITVAVKERAQEEVRLKQVQGQQTAEILRLQRDLELSKTVNSELMEKPSDCADLRELCRQQQQTINQQQRVIAQLTEENKWEGK